MVVDFTSLAQSPADDSWQDAYDFVSEHVVIPSHVQRVFRLAWLGILDPDEFFKVLGFSRLSLTTLMGAAEVKPQEMEGLRHAIDQALMVLGIRLTAVVLAVDYICQQCSKEDSPAVTALIQELMADVEMGYHLGAKTHDLGIEGGALLGFARHAGRLVAQHADKHLRRYLMGSTPDNNGGRAPFETYQLTSCLIQRLGFGTDVAVGVALGAGMMKTSHLELSSDVLRWKAGYAWLDALKTGRSYPRDPDMRSFFEELVPPRAGERNMQLEVLYTEIGRIKSNGSEWMWFSIKDRDRPSVTTR